MSRQQLEAAYRGVLDRKMLEALDEPWDIRCENPEHGEGPHEGPATHWVEGPCENTHGFRCLGLVRYVLERSAEGDTYRCAFCGDVHAYSEAIFTPLVKS